MIVVRVIKPGRPFQSSIFRDEMKKAAETIKKDILTDYKRTYVTWKHKPTFSSKVDVNAQNGIRIQVATDNVIYGYVDEGTRPHIIKAKTPRGLLFKTGGQPKTDPNVIQAFPGRSGTDWKNKMQVNHPGTEPRNFTKHIAKTYKPELAREVKNALARFVRRSGYEIRK